MARTSPDCTATAVSALREVCEPLVWDWLNSMEYTKSRRTAFAWMIRNKFREERYDAERPTRALRKYRKELLPSDYERLERASTHLNAFLACTQ